MVDQSAWILCFVAQWNYSFDNDAEKGYEFSILFLDKLSYEIFY